MLQNSANVEISLTQNLQASQRVLVFRLVVTFGYNANKMCKLPCEAPFCTMRGKNTINRGLRVLC